MTERSRTQTLRQSPPPEMGEPIRGKLRTTDRGLPSGTAVDIAALCGALIPTLARRDTLVQAGAKRATGERVERFVSLLLDEDDPTIEERLFQIASLAGEPQAVAHNLLGPSARLLGDYWRMDICDFMKVTIAMSRLQRLFWTMARSRPPREEPRAGRTALLVPVPDEQHSFGLGIVEDALLRAGWQVDCCAIDEHDTFFELLASNRYSVVGLSLGGTALAPRLASFIRECRKKSRNSSAGIVVGGSVFVDKPALAFDAGADFLALDASSAVKVAEAAAARQEAIV